MGRGICTRLAAGGNRVKILDTDPDQARQLEGARGQRREAGGAEGGAAGDPLSGDVVVLPRRGRARGLVRLRAVRHRAVLDQLDGKIVDITNPVDVETFRRPRNAPRQLRRRGARRKGAPGGEAGEGNTTFAGTLVEGPGGGAAARRLHRGRRRRGKQTVGELPAPAPSTRSTRGGYGALRSSSASASFTWRSRRGLEPATAAR
jgi:hypothetical protein